MAHRGPQAEAQRGTAAPHHYRNLLQHCFPTSEQAAHQLQKKLSHRRQLELG
jgi:hypothetical protein